MDVDLVVVGRQYDDLGLGLFLPYEGSRLDAVHDRHADIQRADSGSRVLTSSMASLPL